MVKKTTISLAAALLVVLTQAVPVYAIAPKEVSSFETMTTQSVTADDLTSPYTITGESLVSIIKGMVDFDVEGSSIVFNRKTGQLFIKHTPTEQATIEQIINDMRAAKFQQVEIEARMISLDADDFEGLGASFLGVDAYGEHSKNKIGTTSSGIKTDNSYNTALSNFASFVDGSSKPGAQLGFHAFSSNMDISAAIQALEQVTEVNTLACPRLTVFNNQRANLKIQKLQNFVSEVEATFDTTDTVTNTTSVWFQVETKVRQAESGTLLDVTPTINSDGTITLDLHPSYVKADLSTVSTFENLSEGDDENNKMSNEVTLPVFTSQSIDTVLTIENGGVAAIGGLINEEEVKYHKKTPILGDIPGIGDLLFSQKKIQNERSYIIIFIKAKIKDTKLS